MRQRHDSLDLIFLRQVRRVDQHRIARPERSASRPSRRAGRSAPSPRRSPRRSGWRPSRWISRRRARSHGSATRKIFSSASGKTTVPMSRPSTTTFCVFAAARTWAFTQARTRGICATRETFCVTSSAAQTGRRHALPSISGTKVAARRARSATCAAPARTSSSVQVSTVGSRARAAPPWRAIQRAGIDVKEAESAGDPLRRRRLPGRGGSVDRDHERAAHVECTRREIAPEPGIRDRDAIADRRSRSRSPRPRRECRTPSRDDDRHA